MLFWSWSTVSRAETINIAILTDGPTPNFQRLQSLFTEELLGLTDGEFDIRFDETRSLDGNWSIEEIGTALKHLQHDPKVDIVLALGFVSSLVASRSDELLKPTFAPMVLDSNLVNLPRSGNTSGVRNLNYLTEEVRFTDDVIAFSDIVEFDHLVLLVDKTIYDSIPELAEKGLNWAAELGIQLSYVLNEAENEDLLAKLPSDADAVMVAALPRLNARSRHSLIDKFIERGLPSYSLIGTSPVEQGMLAATAPDSDWARLARRNALNIQAVLLGEHAGDQSVSFRHKRQLTINMDTARKLNISPRFDVLSGAALLNEDTTEHSQTWDLASVAKQAIDANLDIKASATGLKANAELETQSRSLLRPQFNTSIGVTQINNDNPGVLAGQNAERTTSAAIELSQVIYSEPTLASIEIEHHAQAARVASHKELELDTVQRATVGFLNILKAQTLVNIRRRSLSLSRTNLDLANDRVLLGSTSASDQYRWQSEVATSRQDLLAAQAQLEQSKDALNRLIGRPITERFNTTPASIEDPSLLVSNKQLTNIINNQRAFDALGSFFVQSGIKNSPEISNINAQIASSKRQLTSSRKAFWSPTVSLSGRLSHTLDESPDLASSREDDSNWQVAVNLTLPLHQGGNRKSKVSQAAYNLQLLTIRKAAIIEDVEQSVRANLHAVQGSFPAIELAQAAANAAQKNLQLVQDNYNQGNVSIIDFLDARDASLNADQRATDAVYDFVIDLMNLQRASAEFDFFLDAASLDKLATAVLSHVSSSLQTKN